jgi:FeS assembly protein IscX
MDLQVQTAGRGLVIDLSEYRMPVAEATDSKERTMAKELTWDDAEDIGILLSEAHPEINPLEIRFTDLHQYITKLPDFKDDPKKSNEGKLEAIQMAWHEEFLDRTQG